MVKPLPRNLYPSDPLIIGAWASALKVHLSREDCIEVYRRDTGDKFEPASTPMDKLIQDSTGQEREFLIRYINWFNLNVWGDLDTKAGA